MDAEIALYREQIRSLIERVCEQVDGLDASLLNKRPAAGSNSAYAIASHVLGNARAWVLGIACGRPVERDRPREFAASGVDAAGLRDAAERLLSEIDAALAALDPARMNERLVPPASLWGEGEPREISVRQALLEVVEHASIHLGQLHVSRDWLLSTAKG